MKKRVQVNGKAVEVEAGATLLDAARSVGVRVPTLCHVARQVEARTCLGGLVRG